MLGDKGGRQQRDVGQRQMRDKTIAVTQQQDEQRGQADQCGPEAEVSHEMRKRAQRLTAEEGLAATPHRTLGTDAFQQRRQGALQHGYGFIVD
ncbi:hypothetical protein HC891_10410 [Candidatus Gracilibacteria bacterium]|nr:hypothetical protein [Candidatus Gracilibacteria bacterium]